MGSGVARIYQMSLNDGALKALAGSGFWQRYARASFDGGRTIKGPVWPGGGRTQKPNPPL